MLKTLCPFLLMTLNVIIFIIFIIRKINRNNWIISKIFFYCFQVFLNPSLFTMSDDDDEIFLSTFKNIFKYFEHFNIFIGESSLLFNVEDIVERYLTCGKIISYLFYSFFMWYTTG